MIKIINTDRTRKEVTIKSWKYWVQQETCWIGTEDTIINSDKLVKDNIIKTTTLFI